MAGINVNQRGVNPSLLKQKNVSQTQAQGINTEGGVSPEAILRKMVQKLCTGGYGSFNKFKEDLVKNGIEVNNLQIVQLEDGNSSMLTFEFNGKNYKFNVPTECVVDLSTSGQTGAEGGRGVQGSGAINAPNGTRDIDYETTLQNLLNEASSIESRLYELIYGNFPAAEWRDIENRCFFALGKINMCFSDTDFPEELRSRFEYLQESFTLKSATAEAKLLEIDHANYLNIESVQSLDNKIQTLIKVIKKGNGGDYKMALKQLDILWDQLDKYKDDYPDLENEISKLEKDYLEAKKLAVNNDMESANNLDNEAITEKIKEYDSILDGLENKLESFNPNQDLESILDVADILVAYDELMKKFKESNPNYNKNHMSDIATIKDRKNKISSSLANAYSQFAEECISDNSLSIEEASKAQKFADAICAINSNITLPNTLQLIANGWQEGDMPEVDLILNPLGVQDNLYAQLLNLDTSTYTGKKQAVELINQILQRETFTDPYPIPGHPELWPAWLAGYNLADYTQMVNEARTILELRKDFLEQQIEAMEKRMVKRTVKSIDIPFSRVQNSQVLR